MTEGSMGVCEENGRGGGWLAGVERWWWWWGEWVAQNNHTHSHLRHRSLHPHTPPIPPSQSPPINRSENMSDWIFSSKSSGLGFCWSTPCQHPLKQAFNAPAPAIFHAKYGVNGQDGRREGKQAGGKEGWRTKTSGADWSHCLQL